MLWARLYAGLRPLDLRRPGPHNPSPTPLVQPPPLTRFLLVPSTVWSVLWVIGLRIIFVVVSMCCVIYCFSGLGEVASRDFGHKCEALLFVCVLPWRLFVHVLGVSCMLGCLVFFP